MLQQRKVINVTESPKVVRVTEPDDIVGILRTSSWKEGLYFIGKIFCGACFIIGLVLAFGK